MAESETAVALLCGSEQSREQVAAESWCRSAGFDVDVIRAEAVAGDASLSPYDVVWWHADAVPDAPSVADLGSELRSFVADGGGLVLSLAALSAVDELGIDPVAPDDVVVDPDGPPAGPLLKSLHEDLPVFEGVERRSITREATGATVARYEAVLPERGEVLAATRLPDRDEPGLVTAVGWSVGEGSVVGLGDCLVFDAEPPADVATARDALATSLLANVADTALPDRPHDAEGLAALRERLADDPHRPSYHLSPPANWLNDPNGLVQWNGRYHVFYQYNPGGPNHDTIHWGHAVSDDLLHWEDEPVALTPSPDGPDRDGCWSGCAVDDDGTPTLLYTGGRGADQLPCLAITDDPDLRTWAKSPDNPIIEAPPEEPAVLSTDHWDGEFRDHCVWREDGTWYQLIGAGLADGGGAALLYAAEDLREWEYRGPILTGDYGIDGVVWECPELLDLGDRSLLHVSNYEDVVYFLGEYADGAFEPEERGLLDHGDFYAPQSMRTDDGRLLTWGWLPEARTESAHWDAGWAGALSLPRELSVDGDGDLRQRPAPELRDLRGARESREDWTVAPDSPSELDLAGRSLELRAEVALADADAAELAVLETPDREERTALRYTREGDLVVDRSAASLDPETSEEELRMPVPPYDEPLDLQVYVDGSVVEVFANERHCLTARVYPTREDATGVSLTARGGAAEVSLDAWELAGTF
ncbi:GH32 C-terminal domain-containing protein [Halomicrobium salinisoli]|uniref:GH32 C-terminal domain-containing protein n=1 Tax=Halomicrobium salinisoli TaxID=2878391 RepID=UPI001CF0A5D4|nr:GH32 C-terminal domain-containing protein [Halomicrobium salinisoli]